MAFRSSVMCWLKLKIVRLAKIESETVTGRPGKMGEGSMSLRACMVLRLMHTVLNRRGVKRQGFACVATHVSTERGNKCKSVFKGHSPY